MIEPGVNVSLMEPTKGERVRPEDDGLVDRVALERALAGDKEVFERLTSRELKVLARYAPRRLEELFEQHGIEPEVDTHNARSADLPLDDAMNVVRLVNDGASKASVARQYGVTRKVVYAALDVIGVAA